nr:B3 domain-containing protein At5g60140-like [Ipomoea batatas]
MRVLLRNREKKVWMVEISKIRVGPFCSEKIGVEGERARVVEYVLKEVIRDYNLQLPSTVTLRDAKGREWKTIVKVWADGRTWLSGGWQGRLCRRNLIGEEDQCICKFLPSELGNDEDNIVLQVTVIKEDVPLQMRNEDEDI